MESTGSAVVRVHNRHCPVAQQEERAMLEAHIVWSLTGLPLVCTHFLLTAHYETLAAVCVCVCVRLVQSASSLLLVDEVHATLLGPQVS